MDIQIKKVDADTQLYEKLIEYVENCSWLEVRDHVANNLKNRCLKDWETMFAAMDGDAIVGMCSLLKTDYYPLPDIYPWVSTVFVSEAYRGRRVSGMLIDAANTHAKTLGFAQTYIPSEHIGLYEKYGYRYVRDIVNYGGDTDRLYVKDI